VRRWATLLLFGLTVLAPAALAQGEGLEDPSVQWWKLANFVILAGGLGYLARKHVPPFFAARSRKIREDIIQADEMRQQADTRAREVERRLANLEAEIAALRAESESESASETERMRLSTESEMAKIRIHAEHEIAAAGKAARLELKRYSAQLAVSLAEEKVRARMTPDTQDQLVRGFVRELDRPAIRTR